MDRNRVTVRYAKALIELASEQNVLEQVDRDMRVLFASFNQFEGFTSYIINPGNSSKEKFAKVESIFASDFHELSMRFIQMVFKNNREEYLKDLCRNIIELARELKGIVTASLTSAISLNNTLIGDLKSTFEKNIKATLDLTTDVNPEILGGFIFTIDGQQYDASLASKLNAIKKQLQ